MDGTKIQANASRHSALSYGHAKKIKKQFKKEVQQLHRLAEQADGVNTPDGMSIPEELERRERLAAIAEAKVKIEARAEEQLERAQAGYQGNCSRVPSRKSGPIRSPVAALRNRPPAERRIRTR